MRSSLAQLLRSLFSDAARPLSVVIILYVLSSSSAYPQTVPLPNAPGAPAGDVSNIPKSITDTMGGVDVRNGPRGSVAQGNKVAEPEATCLLPPLSLIASPIVSVGEMERTAKARNEYWQGCVALKKKRNAEAEQHFRKAVRQYPKYAAALVTLGQLLEKEQHLAEARTACSQALTVDPAYAPAPLCLADIAAREHSWKEVLALSSQVLEKDPSSNFVAYEYNAAANLNLHDLAAAEKSGLRAAEIDRDHREPRIYFVLAQVYEAKREPANLAVQLREYLKYADSPVDAAMVQQYLSNLERQTTARPAADSPESGDKADWSTNRWAPPDIDATVPRVLSDGSTCPLPQILREVSSHTLDLIESMRRFSASEQIQQIEIDRSGKRRNSGTEVMNYVVEIEQTSSGYPSIQEYRAGTSGIKQAPIIDTGAAVFALIFHPSHLSNFDFRCEGLADLQGTPAWQVHFLEGEDPNKAFTAIRYGRSIHLPRFKGRAWISADGYNVLRIETDLVNPITKIDLQREHQIITYAPVDFPAKHIRLWLPDNSSIYIASHRHHYERVHTFGEFQLFSVDSAEAVKEPMNNKLSQYLFQ